MTRLGKSAAILVLLGSAACGGADASTSASRASGSALESKAAFATVLNMQLVNDLKQPVKIDCFGCEAQGRTLAPGESVTTGASHQGVILDNASASRCLSLGSPTEQRDGESAEDALVMRVSTVPVCAPDADR